MMDGAQPFEMERNKSRRGNRDGGAWLFLFFFFRNDENVAPSIMITVVRFQTAAFGGNEIKFETCLVPGTLFYFIQTE